MSTDIQREESFRTALRNQKRRLSATEKKPSVTEFSSAVNKSVLGGLKTRDSLTPPRRDLLTPPRSSFTPPRKTLNRMGDNSNGDENSCPGSKQSTPDIRLEYWDINELSPLSTPAVSRSPSPFDLRDISNTVNISRSPSPRMCRSPLPPNSPLLTPQRALSPALNRVKSFNKDLRRARSFRNAREKSSSRNSSAANSRCSSPCPEGALRGQKTSQEVSFSIKKSFGSRKGWKIMPDDEQQNIDASALKSVVSIIKDMELNGFAVPERISIKIP